MANIYTSERTMFEVLHAAREEAWQDVEAACAEALARIDTERNETRTGEATMSNSIRLSEKHGVNPAIPICFYCNEAKNEIILAGYLRGDAEAPRAAVWNMEPCDKCEEWMKQGIILVSTREGETGDNPYRTGGWAVVRDEAIESMINPPELVTSILRARFAFVPDDAWEALGLPREAQKEE